MKSGVAIFLVLVVCVSAQQTPVKLCGRTLAEAWDLLCFGTESVTKRMMPAHNMIERVSDDQEEMEWPWKGRRGALSASWTRYKRGGIADECCLKPCTTDVILSYC